MQQTRVYPKKFKCHHVAVACSICMAGNLAWAGPINFSQIPAGNGGREPAPNVIISVDDSGSMAWDIATDNTTNNVANRKITLLKQALKAQFGDGTANSGNIPDGRIRLAWQGMNRTNSLTLGATNAMKPFSGTHRVNFNSYIDGLTASGGTPSIDMMKNVFNYMRSPAGRHSPWADNPGTDQTTPYLSCRRTYHVFMTDGAWNSQLDTDRVGTKGDSSTQTLPDGKSYNPSTNIELRIYKDIYGDGDVNYKTTKAHTLSDFAFRNWATDLQDGTNSTQAMQNKIKPLFKVPTTEYIWNTPPISPTTPCTDANGCTALTDYWNPKNNPATWQHVTQYTIGFGLGAVNWPYVAADGSRRTQTGFIAGRKTPVEWDYNNASSDTYGGDYQRLVRGTLVWPDVRSYDTSPSTTDTSSLDPLSSEQDQRTVELWHAAINGRGKYYPAKTAAALTDAFKDILDTVIKDTSSPLVSISTSSSYLRSGLNAYIAGYNATRYSGSLTARPIDSTTGAIGSSESWDAAKKLDELSSTSLNNRLVLSYGLVGTPPVTIGFQWKAASATSIANLPTLHQAPLNKNSAGTADNKGVDRVNFIRGDRTKEASKGGTLRDRDSRLGDVVNSNIWYTGKPSSGYTADNYATFRSELSGGGTSPTQLGGRTPMIYIGANDGMLHGFSATTGEEKIAYIPQGIAQGALRDLTDSDSATKPYLHRYFVDGSPFTGDFYDKANSKWRTYLIGTLAAGGKGYFVLDVTDPAEFVHTNSSVGNLVIMDTTATADADIGHIFSPPVMDEAVANMSRQIVKLNDSRWATVLGNGYSSSNEAPVLLIQYLDGSRELVKISPCTQPTSGTCNYKGDNGLSSPQLIDINGDGKVDIAYAGDLKGNLWKFDLTSATSSEWKTSFGGKPFFVAKRGTASAPITQAFTTAPYWMPHPKGGIMLAVGTGRNLTDTDRATTSTESVYALYDNSSFKVEQGVVKITDTTVINTGESTILPTTLVTQTIASTPLVDGGTSYFTSSNNPVDYDGKPAVVGPPAQEAVAAKRGWHLDFPLSGQRALQNIRSFSGQKILVQSVIPKIGGGTAVETCSASATTERSFQAVLNMFTGAPPSAPAYTFTDKDTFTKEISKTVTMVESGAGDTTIIRSENKTKLLSSNCPSGQVCSAKDFNPGNYSGIRAGFRQLQ